MANTTVQSEQIEDGSITAAKLADGTIVAAELADNAVVTAAINADAVTGAKIADNAIDSEHYTDGSIDTAHIADAQITVGKMAANSVDSDQYVDGSIDTVHIADAQVTTAKITDGNISTGKIADNAVTSAKIDTNIDIAGTFDVTGATTLDSTLAVAGAATFNAGATFSGTVQPSSANGIDLGTNGTEFRTLYLDTSLIASNALTIATGTDLTIDAEGDITLDANGGDISFKDAGTEIGLLTNDSTNFGIFSRVNNADIKFYGLDDSSTITALTLDMSDAGSAYFNNKVGIGTDSPAGKFHVAGHTSSVASIFESSGNGDTVPVQLKVKANNGTTSTQGLYGNAGSASTDNTITLGTSGTSGLTVTNGGNVGIGTTSPDSLLHLNSGNRDLKFILADSPSTGNVGVQIRGGAGEYIGIASDGTGIGIVVTDSNKVGIGTTSPQQALHIFQAEGGIGAKHATIRLGGYSTTGAEIAAYRADGNSNEVGLIFSSHDASNGVVERMRIRNDGLVVIGDASNSFASSYGLAISGSGFRQMHMYSSNLIFANASNEASLSNSGVWTDASDIAYKENIEDISYGLDTVKSLKPRKYKMKANDLEQVGFIAQEIELIVPEVVDGEDGKKTMSYGQLTAVLTKAIQEQQTIIEDLKARIETLEG